MQCSGCGSVCFWASWIFPSTRKNCRKTLISSVFWLLYDLLSLKNHVNVPSKRNKHKRYIFLCLSWRSLTKKGFRSHPDPCQCHGSVPKCHGSRTLMIITYQNVRIIRGESTELNNLRHVPHLIVVRILGYLLYFHVVFRMRIYMFLGLLDFSINKQKMVEKRWFLLFCDFFKTFHFWKIM